MAGLSTGNARLFVARSDVLYSIRLRQAIGKWRGVRYLEQPCYARPHCCYIWIEGIVPQEHPHSPHHRGKADDI